MIFDRFSLVRRSWQSAKTLLYIEKLLSTSTLVTGLSHFILVDLDIWSNAIGQITHRLKLIKQYLILNEQEKSNRNKLEIERDKSSVIVELPEYSSYFSTVAKKLHISCIFLNYVKSHIICKKIFFM